MSAKTYQDEVAQEVLGLLREDVPQIAALIRGELGEPGSPAYVRRLRDRYVGQVLGGLSANTDGARATAEMNRGTDITEIMGVTAREFANAAVRALGYQVPEDGEVKS